MKNLKTIPKILFILMILSVMLSSFFALPVSATGDDDISTCAYEDFDRSFVKLYRTNAYYMDGKYMALEFQCTASDNDPEHMVYIFLYRNYNDTFTVYTMWSDNVRRKIDSIPIGDGSAVQFRIECDEDVTISFNFEFYSWK